MKTPEFGPKVSMLPEEEEQIKAKARAAGEDPEAAVAAEKKRLHQATSKLLGGGSSTTAKDRFTQKLAEEKQLAEERKRMSLEAQKRRINKGSDGFDQAAA